MITSNNWTTEGLPDGGVTYGEGFCIAWQRGSLTEQGRNGAFLLDVLEACKRQLEYYQQSRFACNENAVALVHLDLCIEALNMRLNRRQDESTLGTHQE